MNRKETGDGSRESGDRSWEHYPATEPPCVRGCGKTPRRVLVACFWGMQNHQPGSANRAQGVSARSFFSKFSEKEFFRSLVSMRAVRSHKDPHANAWRFGKLNVLP
jgi:hypothetical protein